MEKGIGSQSQSKTKHFAMNDSESLKSCLHFGVCSAASCLSDPTTSGGVMRMEQCLDLGNKYGFRSFE